METDYLDYDDYGSEDDWNDDAEECHTCGGEGWGVVGVDWDSDDPINGPYDGEVETCWNCRGSGKESDCWHW